MNGTLGSRSTDAGPLAVWPPVSLFIIIAAFVAVSILWRGNCRVFLYRRRY